MVSAIATRPRSSVTRPRRRARRRSDSRASRTPSTQQGQTGQSPQQSQVQQGQAQQGQSAGSTVNLTAEQRTKIQQTVLTGSNVPRVDRVNFSLSVGTVIPTSVRVIEVAPALIEIHPEWRGHSFFVVRDEIVVIDRSHKIVAVVPVGSSSAQAPSGPQGSGGGAAVALNLSPAELRQVQIVLKEKGFYDGPVDGVFGARMRTGLIAFQRSQGFQATGQIDSQTVTALKVNVQQGTQPSATGQGGTQEQPANQQGTQQQPPANQQQGRQGGQQPSTSGQAGQPPANQQGTQGGAQPPTSGSGSDRMQQQAPQSGASGQSGGQAK